MATYPDLFQIPGQPLFKCTKCVFIHPKAAEVSHHYDMCHVTDGFRCGWCSSFHAPTSAAVEVHSAQQHPDLAPSIVDVASLLAPGSPDSEDDVKVVLPDPSDLQPSQPQGTPGPSPALSGSSGQPPSTASSSGGPVGAPAPPLIHKLTGVPAYLFLIPDGNAGVTCALCGMREERGVVMAHLADQHADFFVSLPTPAMASHNQSAAPTPAPSADRASVPRPSASILASHPSIPSPTSQEFHRPWHSSPIPSHALSAATLPDISPVPPLHFASPSPAPSSSHPSVPCVPSASSSLPTPVSVSGAPRDVRPAGLPPAVSATYPGPPAHHPQSVPPQMATSHPAPAPDRSRHRHNNGLLKTLLDQPVAREPHTLTGPAPPFSAHPLPHRGEPPVSAVYPGHQQPTGGPVPPYLGNNPATLAIATGLPQRPLMSVAPGYAEQHMMPVPTAPVAPHPGQAPMRPELPHSGTIHHLPSHPMASDLRLAPPRRSHPPPLVPVGVSHQQATRTHSAPYTPPTAAHSVPYAPPTIAHSVPYAPPTTAHNVPYAPPTITRSIPQPPSTTAHGVPRPLIPHGAPHPPIRPTHGLHPPLSTPMALGPRLPHFTLPAHSSPVTAASGPLPASSEGIPPSLTASRHQHPPMLPGKSVPESLPPAPVPGHLQPRPLLPGQSAPPMLVPGHLQPQPPFPGQLAPPALVPGHLHPPISAPGAPALSTVRPAVSQAASEQPPADTKPPPMLQDAITMWQAAQQWPLRTDPSVSASSVPAAVLPSHDATHAMLPSREASRTALPSREASHTVPPSHQASHTMLLPREASHTVLPSREPSRPVPHSREASHTALPSHEASHTMPPSCEASHTKPPARKASHTKLPAHKASQKVLPSREASHTLLPSREASHTRLPSHETSHTVLSVGMIPSLEASPSLSRPGDNAAHTTSQPSATGGSSIIKDRIRSVLMSGRPSKDANSAPCRKAPHSVSAFRKALASMKSKEQGVPTSYSPLTTDHSAINSNFKAQPTSHVGGAGPSERPQHSQPSIHPPQPPSSQPRARASPAQLTHQHTSAFHNTSASSGSTQYSDQSLSSVSHSRGSLQNSPLPDLSLETIDRLLIPAVNPEDNAHTGHHSDRNSPQNKCTAPPSYESTVPAVVHYPIPTTSVHTSVPRPKPTVSSSCKRNLPTMIRCPIPTTSVPTNLPRPIPTAGLPVMAPMADGQAKKMSIRMSKHLMETGNVVLNVTYPVDSHEKPPSSTPPAQRSTSAICVDLTQAEEVWSTDNHVGLNHTEDVSHSDGEETDEMQTSVREDTSEPIDFLCCYCGLGCHSNEQLIDHLLTEHPQASQGECMSKEQASSSPQSNSPTRDDQPNWSGDFDIDIEDLDINELSISLSDFEDVEESGPAADAQSVSSNASSEGIEHSTFMTILKKKNSTKKKSPGGRMPYCCPLCKSEKFDNYVAAQAHIMKEIQYFPYHCDRCSAKFTLGKELVGHYAKIHKRSMDSAAIQKARHPVSYKQDHLRRLLGKASSVRLVGETRDTGTSNYQCFHYKY